MKILIGMGLFLSTICLGGVTPSNLAVEGLPSITQHFTSRDEPPDRVERMCWEWIARMESELGQKGFLVFKTGCTRNSIVALPTIIFYGHLYFYR